MNRTAPAFDAEETQKSMAINALAENFGKEFSPGLLELWIELLEPYSAARVKRAAKLVIERYEFKTFPPFAVFKNALDELAGTSEKALELQAIAEWGIVLQEVARSGPYRAPTLHRTTEHALRLLGGWDEACRWNVKELDFKRRDFIRLWMDSHGRVERMRLGAGEVFQALASGDDRSFGPSHLESVLKPLATGVRQ